MLVHFSKLPVIANIINKFKKKKIVYIFEEFFFFYQLPQLWPHSMGLGELDPVLIFEKKNNKKLDKQYKKES